MSFALAIGCPDALPTLPVELMPYEGTGNPPFRPLGPGCTFTYPRPSSLHYPYARPTRSRRQRHFEGDLARIAVATDCRVVPYAFRDANGVAFRMTATAIDFAVANMFIAFPRGRTPVREVTVTGDLDAALADVPPRFRVACGFGGRQGRLAFGGGATARATPMRLPHSVMLPRGDGSGTVAAPSE